MKVQFINLWSIIILLISLIVGKQFFSDYHSIFIGITCVGMAFIGGINIGFLLKENIEREKPLMIKKEIELVQTPIIQMAPKESKFTPESFASFAIRGWEEEIRQ